MNYSFTLLLITGLLIVVASFCLVFSCDSKKTPKQRKTLLAIALILFLIIGLLVMKIWYSPLG